MATIAEKLSYLAETKALIKAAIAEKGVSVPDDAAFRSYAEHIGEISGTTLLTVTAIDYSGLGNGTFTETLDDGRVLSYQVTQADGRVTAISDGTNTVTVDWGA